MFGLFTRGLILAGVGLVPVLVAAPASNAETSFDGAWNINLITKSGPCLESYSGAGQIIDRVIYFGGAVSGSIAPTGSVNVRILVGPTYAIGVGALSSDSGKGTWHADVTQIGICSGVWNAQRG
jgi:hypothetical protein